MNTAIIESKKQDNRLWATAIAAFIIVQILFFIDEGFYDLRWMKSMGNWIVFIIYMVFLWGGQLLMMYTLFRKIKSYNIWISILGMALATSLAFFVFSGVWR